MALQISKLFLDPLDGFHLESKALLSVSGTAEFLLFLAHMGTFFQKGLWVFGGFFHFVF